MSTRPPSFWSDTANNHSTCVHYYVYIALAFYGKLTWRLHHNVYVLINTDTIKGYPSSVFGNFTRNVHLLIVLVSVCTPTCILAHQGSLLLITPVPVLTLPLAHVFEKTPLLTSSNELVHRVWSAPGHFSHRLLMLHVMFRTWVGRYTLGFSPVVDPSSCWGCVFALLSWLMQ